MSRSHGVQHPAHCPRFRRRFGIVVPKLHCLRTVRTSFSALISINANGNRYADGRKYWTQMIQTSRNIARLIWLHVREREGEFAKDDLLYKLYMPSSFYIRKYSNIQLLTDR